MISLLVYFLIGSPHFLISALDESPTFTIDLPQRKLSAGAVPESITKITHSSTLFTFNPLYLLTGNSLLLEPVACTGANGVKPVGTSHCEV